MCLEQYFEVQVYLLTYLASCRANKSGKNARSAVVAEKHALIAVALARLLRVGKLAKIARDLVL